MVSRNLQRERVMQRTKAKWTLAESDANHGGLVMLVQAISKTMLTVDRGEDKGKK